MEFDAQFAIESNDIAFQPGTAISGTVGNLVDNGDDFLLNQTGGGQILVDPEGLDASQLGLIPGESINVFVDEWDGVELDTNRITRPDGSAVLDGSPTSSNPDILTGQVFDTQAYLQSHPDVATAGMDAWEHFVNYGAVEGRLPEFYNESFYLGSNPDVQAAVVDGYFESGWDHYQQYGAREGRMATPFATPGTIEQMAVIFANPANITNPNELVTDPLTGETTTTLNGTVINQTEPDSFWFQSNRGQILVDASPEGETPVSVTPGESLTVVGEMDDYDFDAYRITRPDGSTVVSNPVEFDDDIEFDDNDDMTTTLNGTVINQTEPDSFWFQSNRGQILVDASPEGETPVSVTPGESLTVVGEMDDYDFDAYRITRADGSTVVSNPVEFDDDGDTQFAPNPSILPGNNTVSGTILAVDGNDFLLDSGNGQILVDAGPPWYQQINVQPGEQVTVVGEYDDDDFDAFNITRNNGESIRIREAGGPPPWAGGWR